MKKIFITIITLCLFNFFLFRSNIIKANSDTNGQIEVVVQSNDDLGNNIYGFSIYELNENNLNSSFVYNEETLITHLNTNSSHKAYFNSIYSKFSIEMDINSIQLGYGTDSKILYSKKDKYSYVFNIKKVQYVNCNIDDKGIISVELYDNNYNELFAPYNVEFNYDEEDLIDNTVSFNVNVITDQVFSFDFYIDFTNYSQLEKEIYLNNINFDSSLFQNMIQPLSSEEDEKAYFGEQESNYNSYVPLVNNGFYQVYVNNIEEDEETNSLLANFILNSFITVDNFYVNTLGYQRPIKTNKNSYYGIYLKYDTIRNNKVSEGCTNYVNIVDLPDGTEGSSTYIVISVEKKASYTVDDLNYILSICAHECYHGVQARYGVDDIWISESTATFMTLYYMDIVNHIQCTPLEERYAELVMEFNTDNSTLIPNLSNGSTESTYGAMLFFAYLYEKFNNISFMKNIITSYYDSASRQSFINRIALDLNIPHDDLFAEFQIYRSFPSVMFTKIGDNYTSLWSRPYEQTENLSQAKYACNYNSYLTRMVGFSELNKIAYFSISTNISSGIRMYIIYENNIQTINQLGDGSGLRYSVSYDSLTLDKSNIYLLAVNCNQSSTTSLSFTISKTSDELNNAINIYNCNNKEFNLSSLLPGNSEVIMINNSQIGYYEFELENFINCRPSIIEIYDSTYELLNKSNLSDDNNSISFDNSLKIVSYMPSSLSVNHEHENPCYIRIIKGDSVTANSKLIVTDVNKINDISTKELNSSLSFSDVYGDEIVKINNNLFGNLSLQITSNDIEDSSKIYIINAYRQPYDFSSTSYELTSIQNEINVNVSCTNVKDVYVLFTNCNNISLSISVSFIPSNEYSIILDKNEADISLMGTEVRINNGLRETNTIMVGLTRCAFLGDDAPTTSRVDYDWYSSDESIVKVSAYGTITAVGVGTAYIQSRCKSNYKYSTICINVYPDNSTNVKYITITTDMRSDPVLVGTEVSSGRGEINGTTIHLGYTRYASLTTDAPSSFIQDYIWESSNTNIAKVSTYGTITAVGVGNVTITCTYKYNSNYIGTLIIQVI